MNMKRLKLSFGILFTSLLTLIGCFDLPEEIIMPEWDVDLNVPLFNKRYSVFDMFKPETKHSITSKLNNEDFYLVESEFYVSNSQVTDYVLLSQNSITKNFLLPANAPSQSVYVLFPDGIEINQATFTSGFISFSIENPSPAVITSTLRIPGIHKPDGSELIIERSISAFSRDSVNYDLANHGYILPPEQLTQNRWLH